MKDKPLRKIAFCITCMNRLEHIRETLIKNMEDNYLVGDVEFVLLDYNSTDGLEQWCAANLKPYIDSGFLHYYKTTEPTAYNRSHSRNMAFRLAHAEIVCNLDADNFLGKEFAEYMLELFSHQNDIFCTSTYAVKDVTGRICLRKNDFIRVRGYNEAFTGYGFEDLDLYDRLIRTGLKQVFFHNIDFYKAISHTDTHRLSEDDISKEIDRVYIAYLTPAQTNFLLFYKNKKLVTGTLINNPRIYYNIDYDRENFTQWCVDERSRIVLADELTEGSFSYSVDTLQIIIDGQAESFHEDESKIYNQNRCFYRIKTPQQQAHLLTLISDAMNYRKGLHFRKTRTIVNPNGCGQGIVYESFYNNKKIVLEKLLSES